MTVREPETYRIRDFPVPRQNLESGRSLSPPGRAMSIAFRRCQLGMRESPAGLARFWPCCPCPSLASCLARPDRHAASPPVRSARSRPCKLVSRRSFVAAHTTAKVGSRSLLWLVSIGLLAELLSRHSSFCPSRRLLHFPPLQMGRLLKLLCSREWVGTAQPLEGRPVSDRLVANGRVLYAASSIPRGWGWSPAACQRA